MLFFFKMAPRQSTSRRRAGRARRTTKTSLAVILLLLGVAALGLASSVSAHGPHLRSRAPAENAQETSSSVGSNNNNAAASASASSAVQESGSNKEEVAAPHSHEPASGMGSRPPMQPPLAAQEASIPVSNRAAQRSSGAGSLEVNSVAAGTMEGEAPLVAKAPEAAAEQPPQPRPPQPPPTPEQHRALRQRDREVVHEVGRTPMDPEWRRLVRRGVVPASGFRRGGRDKSDGGKGGNLGADAPELEEKVPALEAILHLDGNFIAPSTLSLPERDSAIAAAVADVLGVPRSSVAVAEAASDGSDYKAPAAAAAAEKPASRRSLLQAAAPAAPAAPAAAPKASSSPAPTVAAPAAAPVVAAAPAAAAAAPAVAAPVSKPSAAAPALAAPAPVVAPAAAVPSSSLPALKDIIVRVDNQKTGSGEALAKKLAAAAADGTLAKALRSRGFTADSDTTAVGASIAADPTEATWKDKLPFPFWVFIVIVSVAGGLLLLALLSCLVFCCCCTPAKRVARKERNEEYRKLKAEAAAAKAAAKAEGGNGRMKGGKNDVESGGGAAAAVNSRRAVAPAPDKDGSAPADVSSTIKLLRDYAGELQTGGNGAAVVAAAAGAGAGVVAGPAAAAAASAAPAALDARALAATKRAHLPPAPTLEDDEEIVPGTPSAAAAAKAAGEEHTSVSDAEDEAASVLASPRSLALPTRELTARLDAANARLASYVGSLTVKTAAPVVASLLASLRARAAAASAPPPASEDEAALHAAARALVDAGAYGTSAADPKTKRTAKNGAAAAPAAARFVVESARVATATTVIAVGKSTGPSDARRRSSAGGGNNSGGGAPVDITLFVDGSEFESARAFASVARDAEFVPTVLEIEPPGALVPGGGGSENCSVPALAGIVSERGRYSLGEWLSKHRMSNALTSSKGLDSPIVPAQAARVALVHALESLTYLHSRGLCHRDVTPDTLRWHDAGRRWRLALPRASRWARSGSGSAPLSYSLRYAAPEIVAADALSAGKRLAEANAAAADSANTTAGEGKTATVGSSRGAGSGLAIAEMPSSFTADPASDVWAVGLLAWEAFSGRPLFGEVAADGSSAATMSDEQVAAALLGFRKLPFESDPSLWVSFADGGAAELVKSMLSRAPDARPSAVQALRAATKLAASRN